MIKNWKIGTKLAAAFGVVIATGLVGTFVALGTMRSLSQSQQAIMKASEAAQAASRASTASATMAYETVAYVAQPTEYHWNAKLEQDEIASKNFDEAINLLKVMPGTGTLQKEAEAFSSHDEEVCNPLENKALEAAKAGNAALAQKLINEQYVPARNKLAGMIEKFTAGLAAYRKDLETQAAQRVTTTAIICGVLAFVSIFVSVGIASVLSRYIRSSIQAVIDRFKFLSSNCIMDLNTGTAAVAKGDLTFDIQPRTQPLPVESADEFGQLNQTFNEALERIKGALIGYNDSRNSLSALVGDIQYASQRTAQSGELLRGSTTETSASAQAIGHTVEEVARGAQDTAQTCQHIAQASQDLARNAEQASKAMNDLGSSATAVGEGVDRQYQASDRANEIAMQTSTAVEATIESISRIESEVASTSDAIRDLGERQEQIGAIVSTIDEIATQTNLLALNAAIEAARAGEHGQGFAVVADEVRKLAERSGEATKQIAGLIQLVKSSVNQAIQRMEATTAEVTKGNAKSAEARSALAEILSSIDEVKELASVSKTTADGMQAGVNRVTQAIESVASISEETAASAQELSATSEEIAASAQEMAASVTLQNDSIQRISTLAQELGELANTLSDSVGQFKTVDQPGKPNLRLAA